MRTIKLTIELHPFWDDAKLVWIRRYLDKVGLGRVSTIEEAKGG